MKSGDREGICVSSLRPEGLNQSLALTALPRRLTRRLLALEVAHQLDVLVDVEEALQLPLVVDDLHGVLDHLRGTETRGGRVRGVKKGG